MGIIIAEIWLCLLIAALIGFLVGWLLRRSSTKHSANNSLTVQHSSEIAALHSVTATNTSTLESIRSEIANLSQRLANATAVHPRQQMMLESRSVQEANVISEHDAATRRKSTRVRRRKRNRQLKKDDLKLIVGVGPVLERRLNKLGVYRFRQIARWGAEDVNRFARLLGSFGDRITREGWVEGAKELHNEQYSDKL